jgi:radical SAM protein with 4Fe4S-binding SPASM domain
MIFPANQCIDKLLDTVSNQYNIKSFVDLGDITVSPQAVYEIFDRCYQVAFDPDDRLIFYTSNPISDELISHLYRAANLIDISNFFILICSPYDLTDQVHRLVKTSSADKICFKTLVWAPLSKTKLLSNNYMLPDTVCPLPWMHLEIKHNGSIAPCCVFDGSVGNIKTDSLQDVFNNADMNSLRNNFLNGKKHNGCKKCWDSEKQGLTSNRSYHVGLLKKPLLTRFLTAPTITSLDIKPGNTCNFKCRICGPESSSLYAAEQKRFLKTNLVASSDWIDSDQHINQLIDLLPNLRNIDMYGGEPFLIKKFNLLLKHAVDQDHAGHIRLHYNTNGSIYPHLLIEYWKHFQHVDIQLSIDNIGSRFELERGGSWSVITQNIKQLLSLNLSNLSLSVMPAISIMNVFYLDELINWAKSLDLAINPIYVTAPKEFSIRNLTKLAKEQLFKKYKNYNWPEMHSILESIKNYPDSDGIDFVNKTQWFDSVRHENFSNTHPEIANVMGYVYNKDL